MYRFNSYVKLYPRMLSRSTILGRYGTMHKPLPIVHINQVKQPYVDSKLFSNDTLNPLPIIQPVQKKRFMIDSMLTNPHLSDKFKKEVVDNYELSIAVILNLFQVFGGIILFMSLGLGTFFTLVKLFELFIG